MWNNEYVARISRLNERTLSKLPLQGREKHDRDSDTNTSPVLYRIQQAHQNDCSFATHFLDLVMSDTGELRVDSHKRPYSRNARLWVYCAESSAVDAPENRTYILDIDPSLFANDFAQSVAPVNRTDTHSSSRNGSLSTVLKLDATTLDIIRQQHNEVCDDGLSDSISDNESGVDALCSTTSIHPIDHEIQLVNANDVGAHSGISAKTHAPPEFLRKRLDFTNPTTVAQNIHRVLALTECLLNLPSMMPRWGPANKILDPTKVDFDCLWSLQGAPSDAIVGQYAYRKLRRLEKEAPYASNEWKQWTIAYCWLELVILTCFDETAVRNRVLELTRENERMLHLVPTDEESKSAAAALGGDVLSTNPCDYPCDVDADSSLLDNVGGSRSGSICKTDKCSVM